MCMMVYLASNHQLPEIEWVKDVSLLGVKRLYDHDWVYRRIKKVSTKRFIYLASSSYEGCGCDFSYGGIDSPTPEEIDAWERQDQSENLELIEYSLKEELRSRSSVEKLHDYLRSNLQAGQHIDLYSYLTNTEGENIQKAKEVDIDGFRLGDSFEFLQHQMIRYYKKKNRSWWKLW